jgi:hypothetical protein
VTAGAFDEQARERALYSLLYSRWKSGKISTEELRPWLLDLYEAGNFQCELPEEAWLELFCASGFVSNPELPPPPEPVTLWRGALLESGPRGLNWTLRAEVAYWHASRHVHSGRGAAGVWRATVPSEFILAINLEKPPNRIGIVESDVLVDPAAFDDLEPDLVAEIRPVSPSVLTPAG